MSSKPDLITRSSDSGEIKSMMLQNCLQIKQNKQFVELLMMFCVGCIKGE